MLLSVPVSGRDIGSEPSSAPGQEGPGGEPRFRTAVASFAAPTQPQISKSKKGGGPSVIVKSVSAKSNF